MVMAGNNSEDVIYEEKEVIPPITVSPIIYNSLEVNLDPVTLKRREKEEVYEYELKIGGEISFCLQKFLKKGNK